MGKGRTVKLSAAIVIAVLGVIVASVGMYYLQRQLYQTDIQNLKVQNDKIVLETSILKEEINVLNNKLQFESGLNSEKRVVIQAKADRVLFAIKNKNVDELSSYVHPQKGLRFSPYTNINTSTDLIFKLADISDLFTGNKIYSWGIYDGSGKPIDLTFNDYYAKFIYDQDYLAAPEISYNQVLQRGNMINNIKTVYPQGVTIEYHFPGFDKQYEGIDWESLKLVFEQSDAEWYLVGIIHEQWTI